MIRKYRAKHAHVMSQNKHLDGKWVYGFLSDQNYINSDSGEFLVDPATISQHSGEYDKNRIPIYGGDIVEAPFADEIRRRGLVKFEHGGFAVLWFDIQIGKSFLGFVKDVEVVGNVVDNPELLDTGV